MSYLLGHFGAETVVINPIINTGTVLKSEANRKDRNLNVFESVCRKEADSWTTFTLREDCPAYDSKIRQQHSCIKGNFDVSNRLFLVVWQITEEDTGAY